MSDLTRRDGVQYHVEIEYRKGSAFSTDVTENTVDAAKKEATRQAKENGWNFPVKKITAQQKALDY